MFEVYAMLQQCDDVDVRTFANCCVWNYTQSKYTVCCKYDILYFHISTHTLFVSIKVYLQHGGASFQ